MSQLTLLQIGCALADAARSLIPVSPNQTLNPIDDMILTRGVRQKELYHQIENTLKEINTAFTDIVITEQSILCALTAANLNPYLPSYLIIDIFKIYSNSNDKIYDKAHTKPEPFITATNFLDCYFNARNTIDYHQINVAKSFITKLPESYKSTDDEQENERIAKHALTQHIGNCKELVEAIRSYLKTHYLKGLSNCSVVSCNFYNDHVLLILFENTATMNAFTTQNQNYCFRNLEQLCSEISQATPNAILIDPWLDLATNITNSRDITEKAKELDVEDNITGEVLMSNLLPCLTDPNQTPENSRLSKENYDPKEYKTYLECFTLFKNYIEIQLQDRTPLQTLRTN